MRLYLANSVFRSKGYDFLLTIEAAAREGFAGVHLYLDPGKRDDPALIDRVAGAARDRGLEIIAHLPDGCTPSWAPAVGALLKFQPEKKAVIHYGEELQAPELAGITVGLENSVAGLQPGYYEKLFREVERAGSFFAFDVPRLFAGEIGEPSAPYPFIRDTLATMGERDYLHLIDQQRSGGGREHWVALGEGLLAPLMGEFQEFPGGIVLEYEELGPALESRRSLLSGRAPR